MKKHREAPADQRSKHNRDPRLSCPISCLLPTRRGMHACTELHVRTVGDFLETDPEQFLTVPNCGESTVRDLAQRVHRFLDAFDARGSGCSNYLKRPLREVVDDERSAHTLWQLGIHTLEDFLAVPREKLLSMPGMGERVYSLVTQCLRAMTQRHRLDFTLLPHTLLQLPLKALHLDTALQAALGNRGWVTVADLLQTTEDLQQLEDIGTRGHAKIADALTRVASIGTEHASNPGRAGSFAEFVARMMGALNLDQQELLRLRIGIGSEPMSVHQLAQKRNTLRDDLHRTLATVHSTLHNNAEMLLEFLRSEGQKTIEANEGLMTGGHLTAGTFLWSAAKDSGDPELPLRLLAFCFPDEFFLLGKQLTRTAPVRQRAIRRALRHLTRPARLPVAVNCLRQQLANLDLAVDRGLLQYMLTEEFEFSIFIDPVEDEMVERQRDEVADRALAILTEVGEPVTLDDLMFHYRDRHRRCNRGKLGEHLRMDPRLLEIGPQLWSLRERHLEEIAALGAEAATMAAAIHDAGHRMSVQQAAQRDLEERELYLLASCLRGDPSLRDLGRGEFCPWDQTTSSVMRSLKQDLKRAMGEVPVARFLENSDQANRQLLAKLIHCNRLFLEPYPDRVDLLENYPFNEQRLHQLEQYIDGHLRDRRGYSTLDQLATEVQQTSLGGSFLTPYMLGDLLRRHTNYELLPGGLISQPALGLGAWIQKKARDVLRAAGLPLTPDEIVAQVPRLAEFQEALVDLLHRDPTVDATDDTHYQVA